VEPNIVIGQTDFSETFVNSGGVSAQSLSCPMGIAILNGKLAIADSGNNRILIFNSIPTSHFPSADLVLGQTAATMNAANQGGRSASSLNGPQGVAFTPLGLLVADSGNHRVLIYNAVPLSSPGTADLVLGQSNFSNAVLNSGGLSAATLAQPTQVLWIETLQKLLVVDPVNSRVLVWSGIPTVNKQNANNVIGQSSMTQIEDGPSATLLSEPADLNWSTDGLMISDKKNHRLLLWQELPSANGVPANFVFGQNSMELNQHGIGSSTYSTPTSYGQYGTKCVLLDSDNHRVLIYDKETFFASRVGNDNE
jgi:hypothetical protein